MTDNILRDCLTAERKGLKVREVCQQYYSSLQTSMRSVPINCVKVENINDRTIFCVINLGHRYHVIANYSHRSFRENL